MSLQEDASTLARLNSGVLGTQQKALTVGQLELALLARFPRADAEEWDRMGLLVGDPAALVTGVAVALDPTLSALEAAEAAGANVLLTHHPAFLDAPTAFSPSYEVASASGVLVFQAVARGIALINVHTALDASCQATALFPNMLSLTPQRLLMPLTHDEKKGYAMLCQVRQDDQPFRMEHLAARCTSVFARKPRVWGDLQESISTVVIANGSASSMVPACLKVQADCLVCGEIRYHTALDAVQCGLCVIELGHDVSELPLCALLAQAAADAGVPQESITMVDQSSNWQYPRATRV